MPLHELILRLTPITKKRFADFKGNIIDRKTANSFAFIKQCRCNPFLKLYAAYLPDGTLNNENRNTLYGIELDGFYYETYIAINGPLNNPDGDDPPPPPPRNQSLVRPPIQDTYICMRNEYLDGARANNNYYPVVAIMDTGIDLRYFDTDCYCTKYPLNYYENPCCLGVALSCGCNHETKCGCNTHHECECSNKCHSNCCCNCKKGHGNHVFGYSFIDEVPFVHQPHNPFDDDKSHKHGTRIAKIIAERTENKVRIMPLKTANYRGEHTFFDIFCAFEYIFSYNRNNIAQNRVRIINASWGFESNFENRILGQYIEEIANYGILFVTAAGNENVGIGIDAGERHYYPAIYSNANNLVYTVTSVSNDNGELAVTNGRSVSHVDIGVVGDENGGYNDPLGSFDPIIGTSYSAAHFTGFVANQMLNNRFDVYNFTETDGRYANSAESLVDEIRPERGIPPTIEG